MMKSFAGKSGLAWIVLAGALLCGAVMATQIAAQRTPAPPAQRGDSTPTTSADPFQIGERLTFRALWSKYEVNAAHIEFSVVERRNFFGRMAWHFRGIARTLDTVRLIYALDDQFDSYTEAASLTSLQYEVYLREQGKQQNAKWRMTLPGEQAPQGVTAARVAPGTRDPLGFLYALRAADWKTKPEMSAPVFDGQHLYQVTARLERSGQKISVPAGEFTASRIAIRVFQHGKELDRTRFVLYLSEDARRLPVMVDAEVPFTSVRIELTASRL
jgi:hypothetical protein